MSEREKEVVEGQEETVEPVEVEEVEDGSDEVEASADVDDSAEQDAGEQEQGEPEDEQGEEKVVEAAKPDDSSAFRQMRQANREKARRIKELEKQLESAKPKEQPLGVEPTLEACDYDAEKFKSQYREWLEKKAKREAEIKAQEQQEQEAQRAWQQRLSHYSQLREQRVKQDKEFEEFEEIVQSELTDVQRGILLKGAKDATAVIAFIGKDPAQLEKYARITDPVEFAFAIAELEVTMKQPRNSQQMPQPERKIRGNAGVLNANARLEQLRAEAMKTGDYTKVVAFKAQQRSKSA